MFPFRWMSLAHWKALWSSSTAKTAYSEFAVCAFADSNVVLEGKPLAELPWGDAHPSGPILVLFVPTVLREVDSKKRDGRLGKIAREFNRQIAPVATTGRPVKLCDGPPAVFLDLAACERIPWERYPDLDCDEPDSKVVAETLHAKGVTADQRLLISNDIRPVALATKSGLKVLHATDAWLRPKDSSPNDKEMQRLKQKVAELEKTEPAISISLDVAGELPCEVFIVEPLNSADTAVLKKLILERTPEPKSLSGSMFSLSALSEYGDHVAREDYDKYVRVTLPKFIDAYSTCLEQLFGQVPIRIVVSNSGNLTAHSLIISVKSSSGWMNRKVVLFPLRGPSLPKPRSPLDAFMDRVPFIAPVIGRGNKHEVHFVATPAKTQFIEANCEDFRHGLSWEFNGVLWLDPRDSTPCTVSVSVTAANMHGAIEETMTIAKLVRTVPATDLFDLATGKPRRSCYATQCLDRSIACNKFGDLEVDKSFDHKA